MPDDIQLAINVRNINALADNVIDLREKFDALERKQADSELRIATLSDLVQKQTAFIGGAMARFMGSGSTEVE